MRLLGSFKHQLAVSVLVARISILTSSWEMSRVYTKMLSTLRQRYERQITAEFSSPGSTFCADSYFGIRSTLVISAVARKRPWSFCQKCRWQVTAKYAGTLRMWLCTKWHGAWLYGVHRTHRDGSSFTWHQPCQRFKYTTYVDIQKRAIKSYSLM